MFEIVDAQSQDRASIKVIGVGGGGGNAVEHMITTTIDGVDFVCANTDAQALAKSSAPVHVQLGSNVTKGLGAGADPELGRAAAIEDRERIREILDDTDMLFITAGMGGGTGTGASPVIAEVARELDVLTVAGGDPTVSVRARPADEHRGGRQSTSCPSRSIRSSSSPTSASSACSGGG